VVAQRLAQLFPVEMEVIPYLMELPQPAAVVAALATTQLAGLLAALAAAAAVQEVLERQVRVMLAARLPIASAHMAVAGAAVLVRLGEAQALVSLGLAAQV
jgi:hypothetical protein